MIYQTINQYLDDCFIKFHNNTAISYPEGNVTYTYGELEKTITQYAKGLIALGVRNEDHVALILPTSPDWILLFLAITKIGAIPVCLNDSDLKSEMEYKLIHSDTSYLFTTYPVYQVLESEQVLHKIKKTVCFDIAFGQEEAKLCGRTQFWEASSFQCEEKLQRCIQKTSFDDVLNIQYTSGTTGNPKAVMSVHYRVLSNIKVFLDNFQYDEYDKILSALPLYHVMGCLFTGILTFMAGGTLVLVSKFKTRNVLEIIRTQECTSFHGVPTMFRFMLNYIEDYPVKTLKKAMVAGDYCGPSLVEDLQKRMQIKTVFPCFGQSEGIGITQMCVTDEEDKVKTTVGKPVKEVTIRIVDEKGNRLPAGEIGEIIAFVPYHMKGYYKDEEATKKTIKNGWLYTGDLGYLDEEGYLVMKGRKKEMIIRGGENISPVEVENVLRRHDTIDNVAVVGIPDEMMGEEVAAFVTLCSTKKQDHEKLKGHIHQYMETNVPKYERPKFLYIIDQFPMTTSGKIQKRKLVESIRK